MAVRLKYAGVPQEKIVVKEDLREAVELAVENASQSAGVEDAAGKITILPSYTALLKISKMKF